VFYVDALFGLHNPSGERTAPMAVEILSRALLRTGQADRVIAVELHHAVTHPTPGAA
jgi:hypothetical protein